MNKDKQLTAVLIGAGHRSQIYADASLKYPEKIKIVAAVDTDPYKLSLAEKKYSIPKERLYSSVKELVKEGKIADIAINGTLDSQHIITSLPLLSLGYDLLLEKPFATNPSELSELYVAAKKNSSRVFVCHVLRYSSFYLGIKKAICDGKIGDIISINMAEDISLEHMIISYVRGQWNNEDEGSPILLAKSCHDIDLMMWLMGSNDPTSVYSVGGDYVFAPEKAPEQSGSRCLVDCKLEKDCPYSAKKHYIDSSAKHSFYVWDRQDMTDEEKLADLKEENRFGRCVWKCSHKGVDHQSVTVTFEGGAVGIFTLTGGAPRDERRINIVGTKGSISGVFEENCFVLRSFDKGAEYKEEIVTSDLLATELHGGGDEGVLLDFCDFVTSGIRSLSCAELSDSINGHLVVFAAEKSRKSGSVVIL